MKELDVGSATATLIEPARVYYDIGSYVSDHYLSTDKNATTGTKWSGEYNTGDTVYLFLKIYDDTKLYEYWLPSTYESVGDGWYRRTVYLTASSTFLGTISPSRYDVYYYVTWVNWDGRYTAFTAQANNVTVPEGYGDAP